MLKMKKSQTWSMDIMLAAVIFIGAIFVVYSFLQGNKGSNAKQLEQDANKVLDNIAAQDSPVGVVNGINIDEQKLQKLIDEPYPDLKDKIKVNSDFCIYLEGENGKTIYLSGKPGIGSSKIKISDQPCE